MRRLASRRLRIAVSYFLVLLLSVAVWVVSTFALGAVMGGAQQIVQHQDRSIDRFTTLMQSINSQHTDLYQFIVNPQRGNLARFHSASRAVAGDAQRIRAAVDGSHEESRVSAVVRLSGEWTTWANSFLILLVRSGGVTRIKPANVNGALGFDARIRAAADRVYSLLQRDRTAKLNESRNVFSTTRLALLGLMIIVGLFLVGLAGASFRWCRQEEDARRLAQDSEVKARDLAEEYRSLVESSPDAIVRSDLEAKIVTTNQRAADLFGYGSKEELSRLAVFDLVVDRGKVRESMRKRMSLEVPLHLNMEFVLLRKDGSTFPGEVASSAVLDKHGAVCGTTAIVRDVSYRKQIEAELQHQALHDALTGLPNRVLLYDRMRYAIQVAQRSPCVVTLMMLDLNRFKDVNDSFGHAAGDAVLKEIALRVKDELRESDTVARLGGDEFAILLPDTGPEDAVVLCDKILERIRQPYLTDGHQMMVGGSIGLATYPTHGTDADSLLRCADVAMYSAKSTMAGYAIYASEIDLHDPRSLVLLADLHDAIESDTLELHYQPQVDLDSGSVNSVEALVRWNHPTRGNVSPAQFVPLAERTDIIRSLTIWVLRTAIAQCQAWRASGKNLRVSVNISTWNLNDPSLPDTVASLLAEHDVPPSCLKLEITETAVMADPHRAISVLKRIAAIGVGLSIDDFGTGNTSLAYLRRMPVDEIKIDGSFVQRMAADEGDAALVRSVIELGHNLHLTVVAEGVEDLDTLEILRAHHCDQSQGYFLGQPMSREGFEEWLEDWSNGRNTKLPWSKRPCAITA
jgi:diguanylate cyclase (GGDEF)-like protein/PAS domain S-box-containing protein